MAGLRARPLLLLAAIGTLCLGGLGGLGGCSKKGISGELQMFKDGGRAVSEFSDTDPGPLHAKKCQTGTIDKIAALVCEYGSPELVSKGQEAAEGWFGETGTALVLRRELVLLALSDRSHADPNGKLISAIAKLFRRVGKR